MFGSLCSFYARVVTSNYAGMGKSLYIRRLVEEFKDQHDCLHQVVTLYGPDVNNDMVVKMLHDVTDTLDKPVVYHLDVSERVSTLCIESAALLALYALMSVYSQGTHRTIYEIMILYQILHFINIMYQNYPIANCNFISMAELHPLKGPNQNTKSNIIILFF